MSKEPEQEIEGEEAPEASDELYERMNLVVDKGQEPMRIDKFLVQRIESASRNKIQKALEAGMVLVNNRQTLAISALAPPRPDAKPRTVPERHGEPSVWIEQAQALAHIRQRSIETGVLGRDLGRVAGRLFLQAYLMRERLGDARLHGAQGGQ